MKVVPGAGTGKHIKTSEERSPTAFSKPDRRVARAYCKKLRERNDDC